jgi:hypothetical protein
MPILLTALIAPQRVAALRIPLKETPMKRTLGSLLFAVIVAACIDSIAVSAEGRWKTGDNGCYWDQYDSGPNQCGRLKVGAGGCYWDAEDSGPDQCSLDMTETEFWNLVAAAEDVNALGTSYSDIQAVFDLADGVGFVDGGTEDLSDVFDEYDNPTPSISCGAKADLNRKAQKATLDIGLFAGGLVGAGIAAAFFFPPAVVPLGVASLGVGLLAAGMGGIASVIGSMSCT